MLHVANFIIILSALFAHHLPHKRNTLFADIFVRKLFFLETTTQSLIMGSGQIKETQRALGSATLVS